MKAYYPQIDDSGNVALKGLRLDTLPREAWDIIAGQDRSNGNIHAIYEKVPWLYAGINLRANAASAVPYQLNNKSTDAPVEKPDMIPGVRLWWDTLPDLIDGMEADRALYGAAYLFKEKNAAGIITNVRRLDPTSIRPQWGANGELTHFERTIKGRPKRLELDEMVCSWIQNRKAENGPGSPPATAALEASGMLKNIDEFSSGYFARGAINTLLIDVEEGGNSESDRERLGEWISRKITGVKNAFNVNVGRRKLNVHEIGSNTGDLALPELTNQKREDIATALGVPQSLLFSNAANYATAQADTLNFHDKVIKPELRKIEADLNRQLFYGLGLALKFQLRKLEIYQDLELRKADSVVKVYRSGLITQNEGRDVLDYDPLEGGDETLPEPAPIGVAEAPGMKSLDPEPAHDVSARDARRGDLEKWQRKAVKRFDEGKPEKALNFESDSISQTLQAAITGALEAVKTATEARQVFDGALTWEAYP